MGENGWCDGAERDFVFRDAMPAGANPKNAIGMMAAATHAVNHVEELAEGPGDAVAATQNRSVEHGGVCDSAAGEQAAALPANGHERLIFEEKIPKTALGQLGLFGTEAFDVELLGHDRLDRRAVHAHAGEFQKRVELPRPECAFGRIAPGLLTERGA